MTAIRFLSLQDLLDIHNDTIAHEGGAAGVRDIGLLESAVAMPQQSIGGTFLHEGVPAMAAAYMFHIVNNHGFVDGNKRAGLAAALVFRIENDVSNLPSPKDAETMTLAVADGSIGKEELTEWFREQCSSS